MAPLVDLLLTKGNASLAETVHMEHVLTLNTEILKKYVR